MGKKNILVFPAGTEIAFEIHNALKDSKFVKLFGGTSLECHADFVFENYIEELFPFVDNIDFVPFINLIIKKYRIDYIYPAHDSALMTLSEKRDEINAEIIASPKDTVKICRSKNRTYEYFSKANFIPKFYKKIEDVHEFPVFIKPTIGQGATDARRINDREHLEDALANGTEYAICEYLPGQEYTIDCFTDKNRKLRVTKMRSRDRIRSGIAVRTHFCDVDEKVNEIAKHINSKLEFKGAWFFQLKIDREGNYKLLEIAPRIAGTMSATRNVGINMPLLTLFTFWGFDVDIIDNKNNLILDRAFIARYKSNIKYQDVYLDYDDTLVVDGKINTFLMMFLYQAISKGIKIHLITKHTSDIYEELEKKCIMPDIFHEIIALRPDEEKYEHIFGEAIFVDDSFSERIKVKEKCGIPVFDVDMIESLIDWRK